MSEFKFACPVCSQHITADSTASGKQIQCPTCFQKIIVPQAPASADSKLIVSATQVGKPRPTSTDPTLQSGSDLIPARATGIPAIVALVLIVCAGGAALWFFRDGIFKSASVSDHSTNAAAGEAAAPPTKHYPVPTNFSWTTQLTDVVFPETQAAGSIHGSGFFCERATLQGGNLTLRQGKSGAADLGVSVNFFAHQGEELSGKTVEIQPDRAPPVPQAILRWKDDSRKATTQKISSGYSMKIAFGQAANGRIPGKIYICLPDDAKSFVAGSFEADIRKPPPPKKSTKEQKPSG